MSYELCELGVENPQSQSGGNFAKNVNNQTWI